MHERTDTLFISIIFHVSVQFLAIDDLPLDMNPMVE